MDIAFRNYKPGDYPVFKENLLEAGLFDETWDSEDSMTREHTFDHESRLIMEVDSQFAGSIHLIHWGGNGAFLFHFALKKQFRGQGLGARLLEEAEKRLKAKGARQVAIFVDHSNKRLIEYYKNHRYVTFIDSQSMLKTL